MKKVLVFSALLWVTLFFVGCNNKEEDKTVSTNTGSTGLEYEEICNKDNGSLQIWDEWWENAAVCFYSDNSFCFVEDVENWSCKKWDLPFYDDSYDLNLAEKSDFAECDSQWEEIVCGKDGSTYSNRCYMEASGIEEETEHAKVVDGKCEFE